MSDCLVFVPIDSAERASLAAGVELSARRAFRVTPELMVALGYGHSEVEDAEYAAMVLASVAGLTTFGHRLVLVAQAESDAVGRETDPENGEFVLLRLSSASVDAFFAESDEVNVAEVAADVRGLSIDEAWERDSLQRLLAEADLLWHGHDEL